jgi:hypothetical protein
MFLPALATVVFLVILFSQHVSASVGHPSSGGWIYMYATQQDAPHRNDAYCTLVSRDINITEQIWAISCQICFRNYPVTDYAHSSF